MAKKREGRVIREWPSSSNPSRSYQLIEGHDGVVYCSCPAWRFSKERPRICKHMKQWAETIATQGKALLGDVS